MCVDNRCGGLSSRLVCLSLTIMSLTSDEINFLIYRYLKESGFEHSAYAFGHESFIYKSSLESSQLAPGALINFVQKGLQYVELESHINEDGTETLCDESFSLLKKHVCRPKGPQARRKIFSPFDSLDSDYGNLEIEDAWMLRQDTDSVSTASSSSRGDSTSLSNMHVCVKWHPLVHESEKKKRGGSAYAAMLEIQQHTLLTAGADGTIKIWQYKDEEDEETDNEEKEGATNKQPFQKGYVCIKTVEPPPLMQNQPNSSSSDAAASPSSAADSSSSSSSSSTTASSSSSSSTSTSSSSSSSCPPTDSQSGDVSMTDASSAGSTTENGAARKRQKLLDGSAAAASASSSTDTPSAAATPASSPASSSSSSPSSCHMSSNRSMVCCDWHPRGVMFAGGSYSGAAYLWSSKGVLLHSLLFHDGPLTGVKFSPNGCWLLTTGVDHRAAVWDVANGNGKLHRSWHLHSGPILDADWCPIFVSTSTTKNRDSPAAQSTDPEVNPFKFATASTDGRIFVLDVRQPPEEDSKDSEKKMDEEKSGGEQSTGSSSSSSSSSSSPSSSSNPSTPYAPILLEGHEGEVNSVSWDPTGTLLLTSSDDRTVKAWNAFSGDILHDFIDHTKEVLIAKWSGTGACTEFSKYPLFIATGSADATVKLFDPATGQCLHTLTQHTHPVTHIAFAPRQQLLLTASHERLFIWSLHSGSLLRTFKNLGDPLHSVPNHLPMGMVGGLNDVAFDARGEQIAVTYADGMSYVCDITQAIQQTNNK